VNLSRIKMFIKVTAEEVDSIFVWRGKTPYLVTKRTKMVGRQAYSTFFINKIFELFGLKVIVLNGKNIGAKDISIYMQCAPHGRNFSLRCIRSLLLEGEEIYFELVRRRPCECGRSLCLINIIIDSHHILLFTVFKHIEQSDPEEEVVIEQIEEIYHQGDSMETEDD
jgi:hypothetical protein